MTPCLRPDEIIDALDGTADRAAAEHLAACARCQAALADVREALAAAEGVGVPEPSPLYWSQVNARVRSAIGADAGVEAAGWRSWLRWDVVVPLAGLATIVVTLASAVGRVPVPLPSSSVAAARVASDAAVQANEAGGGDGALELMLDLVATLPDSDWDTLGVASLPDLGVAAQALSDEEQQALSAILRAAVERPQS